MRKPEDDPTSIGRILLLMGVVAPDDVAEAIERQKTENPDVLLGRLLVAAGVCTREQLDIAVAAQKGLRRKSDAAKACAMADVALFVKREGHDARQRFIHKARTATSDAHPIITREMILESKDK